MAKFKYTAVDRHGKEVKGLEEAPDIQTVIANIRNQGLFPLKVLPDEKRKFAFAFTKKTKIKQKIVAVFTRQLATLVGAGLPIVRALRVLEQQQTAGLWKKNIGGIIESVESGSSLSDALGRYPGTFSGLYVNMVKAGEAGGVLDGVLVRLADFYEKSQKLRSKVISALVYPCLVLGAAVSILMGLMVFVVPKFALMFQELNISLPLMTKFLINSSQMMIRREFWIALFGVLIGIRYLFRFLYNLKKWKFYIDKFKLKMFVTGKLIQKIIVANFARTLGTLIGSGVPILQAISNVKDTVENQVLARGLETVHSSIKEGESIVDPLKLCPVFDAVVINMIAVGEETGKLDDMLLKVADTYESEADIMVAGITSLLEPLLIITLAIIVGFIVISLFLPLISLISGLAAQ